LLGKAFGINTIKSTTQSPKIIYSKKIFLIKYSYFKQSHTKLIDLVDSTGQYKNTTGNV